MLVWAVDGGGTKTHGIIADQSGKVLDSTIGGPCNLFHLGADKCREVLTSLLTTQLSKAGIHRDDISHAFLALGGLDTEPDRQQYFQVMQTLFEDENTKWQVENDVLAALYSGTLGQPGVVLLAGTGSMAMGIDLDNRVFRAGGWGHMIGGDPGSAFSIGHDLVWHGLKEFDLGNQPDLLVQMALEKLGLSSATDLFDWIEDSENPPSQTARLSQIVDAAANTGDSLSESMIKKAATDLVAHLDILVPRLRLNGLQNISVVLAGGMFKSSLYRATAEELIKAADPRYSAVFPSVPPVAGSFVGALKLAGHQQTEEAVEQLSLNLSAIAQAR